MNLIAVTPEFSIAAGMGTKDAPRVAAQGFASVVGLLPDGDADGVKDSDLMRAGVAAEGMAFTHLPVVIGLITRQEIRAFARALAAAEGPVLAYCHSGVRAILMWALAKREELGEATVVALAESAGFDIADYLEEDSEALLVA